MSDADRDLHAALTLWRDAFCRKDVEALMALYADDAVLFDAIPPFAEGVASMRTKIIGCFPHFPDQFAIETKDLTVEIGGDLAFSHCLWRFTDLPPGHPAGRHWLRSSTIWRRTGAGWRIRHDHCSAPFDPYSEKAVLSLDDATPACAANDANPFRWVEIYVADMARAKRFYETLLATSLNRLEGGDDMEMWAFPMQPGLYGASGTLVAMAGMSPGGGGTLAYFGCEDCAVPAARAVAAGGVLLREKFSIGPYGFIALVQDSEGNVIGLHSQH